MFFRRKPKPVPEGQRKFLAVFHSFWMDSKGFKVEEIVAGSEDEAWTQAAAQCHAMTSQFNHVAFTLIDLSKYEQPQQEGE